MSDEKDRLGDKLRQKQQAEENRYFAEEDRRKLEKLRSQSEAEGVRLGACPRDGSPLTQREHHGVAVDDCPRCGGLWLDKGELEILLEREDEGWASRWLRSILKPSER